MVNTDHKASSSPKCRKFSAYVPPSKWDQISHP